MKFSFLSKTAKAILALWVCTFLFAGRGRADDYDTTTPFQLRPDRQLGGFDTEFDWPGFLGMNRNSISSETGILKDWSGGKLKIAWRSKVGEGYVLGAVAGGRFYQFDAVNKKSRLQCLDATTGKLNWSYTYDFQYKDLYEFDEGPRATPLIDDNRVYIYGVEGMLHCLNCDSGKVLWKVDVNKKFGVVQNFFGVGSSPLVYKKFLIVMVGGSPSEDQQRAETRIDNLASNGTGVVVFDKMTGKLIHKLGDDFASYSSIQIYKNGASTFGLAWMRNHLIGFDIENGKELWSYPYRARKYETVNASTPVVKGSEVFLCESYGPGSILLEVSGHEPKIIWNDTNRRKQSLATHWNTPVLFNGNLYASHGAGGGGTEIRCVDWATGKVNWKQRGYSRSSLTCVDSHLVVLAENGELFLIKANPESFQLVTSYTNNDGEKLSLEHPCWAAPIVSNGLLYIRGKNEILCFRLTNVR